VSKSWPARPETDCRRVDLSLQQFADQHRLKVVDSQDETAVIRGRKGSSHLFEYADSVLGVAVIPDTGTSHWWTAAAKAFDAAGMQITQNGDNEGIATFDPKNPVQARVAMKYADVRQRRNVSPAQRAALAKARGMAARSRTAQNSVQKGSFDPRNAALPKLANNSSVTQLTEFRVKHPFLQTIPRKSVTGQKAGRHV
jgi:hypothetical protein